MDGIDIALIETDGVGHVTRIASASTAYSAAFRKQLVDAVQLAQGLTERGQRPGRLAGIERQLTELAS